MTRDAKALYQELILDHGKRPRGEGPLATATHEATAHNALCGDRVTVRMRIAADGRIEVRFEAKGCLISRASASLMTEVLTGRSTTDAVALANAIDALVNDDPPPEDVGSLEPLRAVREFPARKACVVLAWDALRQALASGPGPPPGEK